MNFDNQGARTFAWTRYWQAWNGTSALPHSEGSFLPCPQHMASVSEWLGDAKVTSDDHGPRTLDAIIAGRSVVVLLGRPGAGKTTELRQAIQRGWFNDGEHPPVVRWGNTLGSHQTVRQFLFERDDWKDTVGRDATLIIDGLDEIIQVNPRFMGEFHAELIEEKARRNDAIRLVLLCRGAEWAGSSVTTLWEKNHRMTAELCQLTEGAAAGFVQDRLQDIALAAQFWQEASRLKLHALVTWPHSLNELVKEFEVEGKLPSSHFNLIRAAAMRRSSSWDNDRTQRIGTSTDARWMFRLAGRVAATSLFTGTPTLSLQDWEHSDDGEPWPGGPRLIRAEDLVELKRTDFFDVSPEGCLHFQHQIFREHMAAAWLADRGFTTVQLRKLFGGMQDKTWRHFPQLATVAAWLASDPVQQPWRQFLMEHDPMVLLRADAMNLTDREKLDIAGALLRQALNDGWIDQGEAHQALHTLACDGLADVVRPYLDDASSKAIAARQLALTIAAETRLTSLVPKLWTLVKAPEEVLRVPVARALHVLATDEASLPEWEAVLDEQTPSDEHGTLLGAALDYLIPKYKSVRDALHVLLPARDFHILGPTTFAGALLNVPAKVTDADILPILERSERHHASGFSDGYVRADTILSAAMRRLGAHLDDTAFREAFARWWLARIISHAPGPEWKEPQCQTGPSPLDFLGVPARPDAVTLDELGFNEAARRHAFLRTFAPLGLALAGTVRDACYMADHVRTFVRLPEDIPWLVEQLKPRSGNEAAYWGELLSRAYHRVMEYPSWKPMLEQAFNDHVELRSLLPTVAPGKSVFEHLGDRAEELRRDQGKRSADQLKRAQDMEKDRAAALAHDWALAETQTQAGSPQAWITLARLLAATSSLTLQAADEARDGPAWMREAARLYLRQPPAVPYPGPSGNPSDFDLSFPPTWAVYVLWDEILADETLKAVVVAFWLPFVLSALTWGGPSGPSFNVDLLLSTLGEDATRAYLAVLARSYVQHGGLWQVRALAKVGGDEVAQALAALLTRTPPEPQGFAEALAFLAGRDQGKARQVADHWLERLPLDAGNEASRTLMAALLVSLPGYRWEAYAGAVKASTAATRAVFIQAFGRIGLQLGEERLLAEFPDGFLGELVELLFITFPPGKDPASYRRSGTVSSLDETLAARDRLVHEVHERGLIQTVRRLQDLSIPGTERWFSYAASKALSVHQSAAWQPLKAGNLLALGRRNDLSLVRTQEDFFESIALAVQCYGDEVRTTERLNDIWSRPSQQAHPEEHISDYLAHWLKEQLKLLPSREAQTVRGKKTDIEVSLSIPGKDIFHAVIEVKKSDRDNLMHGMETQLRDDYLVARGKTHGLYVVFWLRDGERKLHPGIETAAQLQAYLDEQAKTLSVNGLHIRALVFDCQLPVPSTEKVKATKMKKARAR